VSNSRKVRTGQPESQAAEPQVAQVEGISSAVARAMLEKERQERIQQCAAEIEAALQRHGCRLDVAMILRPGQAPMAQTQVVATE